MFGLRAIAEYSTRAKVQAEKVGYRIWRADNLLRCGEMFGLRAIAEYSTRAKVQAEKVRGSGMWARLQKDVPKGQSFRETRFAPELKPIGGERQVPGPELAPSEWRTGRRACRASRRGVLRIWYSGKDTGCATESGVLRHTVIKCEDAGCRRGRGPGTARLTSTV
jgi:hypothetical protein